MKKQSTIVLLVFAGLIGIASLVLIRAQTHYKLGAAGVRIGDADIYDEDTNLVSKTSVLLPNEIPGYTVLARPIMHVELNMLPPDTMYGRRIYKATNGFQSQISVVVMGTDRTSIHKPEYCLLGQGWQIDQHEVIAIPMSKPGPHDLQAMKFDVSMTGKNSAGEPVKVHGIYVYWFVADNLTTPSHLERMYWMAKEMLTTGTLQRWAYISYFSVCRPGQEKTLLEAMKSFIAETVPEFQKPMRGQESATSKGSGEMAEAH